MVLVLLYFSYRNSAVIKRCGQSSDVLLIQNLAESKREKEDRVGDGCFSVFIDVGANVGVHGRFLFEPEKYNLSSFAVPLFEKKFGKKRQNSDFCVIAIEANPKHWSRLEKLSSVYRSLGWRFLVVKAAAFDETGKGIFFHQGDGRSNEWGFSVKSNKHPRPRSTVGEEKVELIVLSKWLEHEIFEREVPAVSSLSKKPIVGMKVDIEGSEFVVLPDLVTSGVFCKLDFVFGEFHPWLAPMNFSRQEVSLQNSSDAIHLFEAFDLVVRSARNCKTDFIQQDDEEYLHDTVPLPI